MSVYENFPQIISFNILTKWSTSILMYRVIVWYFKITQYSENVVSYCDKWAHLSPNYILRHIEINLCWFKYIKYETCQIK